MRERLAQRHAFGLLCRRAGSESRSGAWSGVYDPSIHGGWRSLGTGYVSDVVQVYIINILSVSHSWLTLGIGVRLCCGVVASQWMDVTDQYEPYSGHVV